MKRHKLLLLLIIALAGCARPAVEQPQPQPPIPIDVLADKLTWARENIATLEQLPLPPTASGTFLSAKKNLALAEQAFAEELYDEAYWSVLDSLAQSQELVRQFYDQALVPQIQETATRIEAITVDDPNSPLQKFLPALTGILEYSKSVLAGDSEIDLAKLRADSERVAEITEHARRTVQRTLESDLSFQTGQYRLSESGKRALDAYCREIFQMARELSAAYPERDLVIRINIAGYTDQVGFKEDSQLLEQLTAGVDPAAIPTGPTAFRQFLNRRLSEFRVEQVMRFLRECFRRELPEPPLELHGVGLGEDLPPRVVPSGQLSDPRRRVCKMAAYVLLQPPEAL